MRPTEIAKLCANRPHACASTGPRTQAGKSRSSLNAVRHGLGAGAGLLLPGEDAGAYEQRIDAIFGSLAPANAAEAELAALVGDLLWKLSRLERIESNIIAGRVEDLLQNTSISAQAAKTAQSLTLLGRALNDWEARLPSAAHDVDLMRRLHALSDAVEVVADEAFGLSSDAVQRCRRLVEMLLVSGHDIAERAKASSELFSVAGRLMSALLERGDRDEAAVRDVRNAIAGIALPEEVEIRKLARYRKMLEESLLRRLQALEALRKMSAARPAAGTNDEAREFRLRLRVVR